MTHHDAPPSPLVDLALQWLESDASGRISLHPSGTQALSLGVELISASGATARPAVEQLVHLARRLFNEHGAAEAADAIMRFVLSSELARAALGLSPRIPPRKALKQIGSDSPIRAPRIDDPAPNGSRQLKDLVPRIELSRRR